jgi:hypothetical protein
MADPGRKSFSAGDFEARASCDRGRSGPMIQGRGPVCAATTAPGVHHEHHLYDEDRTSSTGGRIAAPG